MRNMDISDFDIQFVHYNYEQLTKLLIEKKLTITTMESCTSGLIASLITDTEGSSAIFKGACVTYSNEAKILNGVDSNVIEKYGVYSVKTALEMAQNCKKLYKSNIGIGVTGTFGNVDPNNKDSVPGKVYVAICLEESVIIKELLLELNLDRFESKLYVAECIVEILLKEFK